MARRLLVLACGALLAACGQAPSAPSVTPQAVTSTSTPSTTPSEPPPPTTTTTTTTTATAPEQPQAEAGAQGIGRCTASMLTGTMGEVDAATGSRHAVLRVTNTSDRACTLYGYGGLELTGADGKPLPTDLRRVPNPGPQLVTLQPGAVAGKNLRWSEIPAEDEPATGRCEPMAVRLDVIPPDDTERFQVPWPYGPACQHGLVEGSAYHVLPG